MSAYFGVAGVSGLRFRDAGVEARRVSNARLVRHPSEVILRAAPAGLGGDVGHHRRR